MPRLSYDDLCKADGNVSENARLDRKDAARFLGVASKTMAEWKRVGAGPRSHKIGGACFYYVRDLRDYVRGAAGHQGMGAS